MKNTDAKYLASVSALEQNLRYNIDALKQLAEVGDDARLKALAFSLRYELASVNHLIQERLRLCQCCDDADLPGSLRQMCDPVAGK